MSIRKFRIQHGEPRVNLRYSRCHLADMHQRADCRQVSLMRFVYPTLADFAVGRLLRLLP
jgi:hypothetical protein